MNGLGTHVLLDLYGCNPDRLDDLDFLRETALEGVRRSGATIVGEYFKQFEPQGVSGVVVIAESHLSFHSWPEFGYIAMDYFTCGDRIDIEAALGHFERLLEPAKAVKTRHSRGEDVGEREWAVPEAARARGPQVWHTEHHWEDDETLEHTVRFQYAVEQELYRRRSEFQEILVMENPTYGRMLVLDSFVNTTERDEWVYHEMLAHVPMLLHGSPEDVLIIGGGDGGLMREVLRHPTVKRVELVEIDPAVVEAAREFLPALGEAFDDPRARVHHEDGAAFVEKVTGRYDLVLVDSTDPVGPGKVLFGEAFYRACRRGLKPGGLFAAQALSPWLQEEEQEEMFASLAPVWANRRPYLATVPTYPGGLFTFVVCANRALDPTDFDEAQAAAISEHCRYYNPELHRASFVLPNFLKQRYAAKPAESLTATGSLC